jgi:predicted RNase H-like HicB family nuclease
MRRVRVQYHLDEGSWWADSPDVPGFTAVAETLQELRPLAREGVCFALDEKVVVEDTTPGAKGYVDPRYLNVSVAGVYASNNAPRRSRRSVRSNVLVPV